MILAIASRMGPEYEDRLRRLIAMSPVTEANRVNAPTDFVWPPELSGDGPLAIATRATVLLLMDKPPFTAENLIPRALEASRFLTQPTGLPAADLSGRDRFDRERIEGRDPIFEATPAGLLR